MGAARRAVILGSPRPRGNTDTLAAAVLEGARELGRSLAGDGGNDRSEGS